MIFLKSNKLCLIVKLSLLILNTNVFIPTMSSSEMDNDSDVEEKLKQALVIIEILKSEYIKTLRNNPQNKPGEVTEEPPTCGPTSSSEQLQTLNVTTTASYTSSILTTQATLEVTQAGMSPPSNTLQERIPSDLYPPSNLNSINARSFQHPYPYNFFKRMPAHYYYYGDLGDDRNFQDSMRVHFNTERTTERELNVRKAETTGETGVQYAAPSSRSLVPTDRRRATTAIDIFQAFRRHDSGRNYKSRRTRTNLTKIQRGQPRPLNLKQNNQKHIIKQPKWSFKKKMLRSKIKLSQEGHFKNQSLGEDPIPHEIASELFNELRNDKLEKGKEDTATVVKSSSGNYDDPQPLLSWKPTLRIYLDRSTRVPIPLPENHAFCYTNPDNALCRTLI